MPKLVLRSYLLLGLLAVSSQAVVPSGFTDALVTDVSAPTALAFTPDGRMLIATQGGSLRIFQNGTLLGTAALTFPSTRICTESERGLLGVAVDPEFGIANNYIYLFYTAETSGSCVNRVSRFTLPAGNVIDPATELVLVDNMLSTAGNHNGGDVQFGNDGYLYISIGDGGCDYANDSGCGGDNDAARDQHVLTGKILRITSTGGIPPSNPFQGAGTARCNVTGSTTPGNKCQETFAWGLRNPFRIAFDPNTFGAARFFINDVGQGAWEEIDLGQAGADYGWNCLEGTHTNPQGSCTPTPDMVPPIFEYSHNTGCGSITGGAFIPNNLWPGATYNAGYLYSDFVCGKIFLLKPVAVGGYTSTEFATGLGGSSAVHMTFGPFGTGQALYYTTYAGGEGGQVRRISFQTPSEPQDFFTLTPCRAVDTRNPNGPLGGPALTGNVSRVFDVRGACGIPATAASIAINVTLASPTLPGFLRLYPWGSNAPGSSILNFSAGQTRNNNAILQLTDGRFTAAAAMAGTNGTAHLIVDVVGYFE